MHDLEITVCPFLPPLEFVVLDLVGTDVFSSICTIGGFPLP